MREAAQALDEEHHGRARRRGRPRPRRAAGRSAGGATCRRPRGRPRRRARSAPRRRGSARSTRSAPTRPRRPPPRANRSRRRLRASRASRRALPRRDDAGRAGRSAVSTTDVTMPGFVTTLPIVQTAPPPVRLRDLADLELELRGAGERVAALVHRRRAGVRRLAAEGDLVALDAERAEHDAERQAERLEHRALLDVQLEVGGGVLELAARLERVVEVDAVRRRATSGSAFPSASLPRAQLVLVGHRAGGGARAEQRAPEARALLVGPVDEPHGRRRRRPPRRAAAAPRRPRRRSARRRASRRSAPSRCARRSAPPGRSARAA